MDHGPRVIGAGLITEKVRAMDNEATRTITLFRAYEKALFWRGF
jgi:hypothetical protein